MPELLSYGVGYTHVPRAGEITELHAIDPASGRSLCGQAVALAWSPEDSRGSTVDCLACLAAMPQEATVA